MSFDPLNRVSRLSLAPTRSPIPLGLIGLAVIILGWIVMAGALRMIGSEVLFGSGFCLVVVGFSVMFWAER